MIRNVRDKERFLSAMGGGALLLSVLGRRGRVGAAVKAIGEALIARGATAYTGRPGASIEESITIRRPREEVYRFCHDLSNLPRFMREISGAEEIVIVLDIEVERITFRRVGAGGAARQGILCFGDAPGGRGTEVTVTMDVDVEAGILGRLGALRRGERAELALRGDLRRLKQLLEASEIPTARGQPTGRKEG